MRTDPVLDVDNVTVGYGIDRRGHAQTIAVRAVSMSIAPGEVLAVVGESGSGKSSLALATLGLIPIQSGTIRILGRELGHLKGAELRAARGDVQIVFQDPFGSLDPRQRVGAGFRELRRLHGKRTSWISDVSLLNQVELGGDLLERYPHQLSGGQIQRVVLARCMLLRPKLLVADEPTSSLDVSVQAQMIDQLARIRDETGVAILFISHDLSLVRHISDRVCVMLRGDIVESGSTDSVFEHPAHAYTRRLIEARPGHHQLEAPQQ